MSLKYLLTILYRPRATMRRILQNDNRWTFQVVALAAVCAAVTDTNSDALGRELFGLNLGSTLALVAVSVVVQAIAWYLLLLLIGAMAFAIGRLLLHGAARFRDVTAALAWAIVPTIWSVLYRIPAAIIVRRLHYVPRESPQKIIIDFFSRGGFTIVVLYLTLQFVFEAACVVLACFTLAEAQKFSTQKGFVNVVSALVFPVAVIFAAVFSLRS